VRLNPSHPAAFLASVVALAGCSSAGELPAAASSTASSSPAERPVAGEPVRLVSATLEDAVVPRDDGRIRWTTTWRACFVPAGGVAAPVVRWEAQLVTPEGASPELEELPDGCVDLDVATGVNAAGAGLLHREVQLSDAASLAYRVRAVGTDGTAPPWTDPVRVTSRTPPG